jgi:hypothetical protein
MTTSTLTVTEFVEARLAEWERWADYESCKSDWDLPIPDSPGHPARVLAQCAAMRKIMEDLDAALESNSMDGPGLLLAVMALASIWSDHSDFREEWR